MTKEEIETMKFDFKRKMNTKFKILGVKWVEKWLLKLWILMILRKIIVTDIKEDPKSNAALET